MEKPAPDASDIMWDAMVAAQGVSSVGERRQKFNTHLPTEVECFLFHLLRNQTFLTDKLICWHADKQNAGLAFIDLNTVKDGCFVQNFWIFVC